MISCRARSSGLTAVTLAALFCGQPAFSQTSETPVEGVKGKLLIATSHMPDPRFREAVLLIIEHDENGAFGLMLNRPLGSVRLSQLLEQPPPSSPDQERMLTFYLGGPMEFELAFFLHSPDVVVESTRMVAEGVAFSTDAELLRLIADDKGPAQFLLASGYAGWAPGQLEEELTHASWLTVDAKAALVFAADPSKIWKQLIDQNVVRF